MADLTSVKVNELDLPFVKEYLKVDYDDEDIIIQTIIVAAQSYIQTALGFKFQDMLDKSEEIPDELTIAALLLIAHWFDHRQMQTVGVLGKEMEFAVNSLLDAHKDHMKIFSETDGEDGADLTHFR